MSAVLDKNGKPMRMAGATNTTPKADAKAKIVPVCTHGDEVTGIAEYMVAEMKRNPFSSEGIRMTELNAYDYNKELEEWSKKPWYQRLLVGVPEDNTRTFEVAAYSIWAERVGPFRPWDHKPMLIARMKKENTFRGGWMRYGKEDYYLDIWSNMHYGYVGIACGFSLEDLLGGAGVAQALSDTYRNLKKFEPVKLQNHPENGGGANNYDDIPDNISIKLGAALYQRTKPAALTVAQVLKLIVGVPLPWGTPEAKAKRPHKCEP